jgi:4-methylaminobutanoate oxidase (formaldehyde-forming)
LTARFAKVRFAPVWAVRADGAGLDGWELHHPIEHQIALYENLRAHGDALGLTNFGMRTYETLRLERSRVRWGSDFSETTPPDECGLSYLTDSAGPRVPARDSRLSKQGNDPDRRLATLTAELSNPDDWLWGGEPVLADGVQIGTVTSAAFGHGIGRHIALAYLPPSAGRRGENLEIEVLGRRYAATVSDGIAQREPSIA